MDVAALTAFLAPFLPHLLKPVQEAAGEAAERFGAAAWEQAKAIWDRLRGKVDSKSSAREAAEDVAKAPESPGARASFQWQLEKLLAEDASFAEELSALWERALKSGGVRVTVTASGERSVAIGGDNVGEIRTGDQPAP